MIAIISGDTAYKLQNTYNTSTLTRGILTKQTDMKKDAGKPAHAAPSQVDKAIVPKRTGRPPMPFNQDVANRLCDWIAEGGSLRKFCEADDNPSKMTVLRWLDGNETFRLQYARAREDQADTYCDDIADISDDEPDPQKARVRIDARKWVAGKLRPKKYGEKYLVGGDDTAGPIRVENTSELAKTMAFYLRREAAKKETQE